MEEVVEVRQVDKDGPQGPSGTASLAPSPEPVASTPSVIPVPASIPVIVQESPVSEPIPSLAPLSTSPLVTASPGSQKGAGSVGGVGSEGGGMGGEGRGGIYEKVEQMPELEGGLDGLLRRLRYPVIARKAKIEGRVVVQFVVDETGKVVDPIVVRGIGAGCDEEALRLISSARYRPGRLQGQPVRVKMSLPITFKVR